MPRATAISPNQPRRTPAVRRLVEGSIALAAGILMFNTWIAGGLLFPCVVNGGSMAPALLGSHRQWQCAACGEPFVCDLESLPSAAQALSVPTAVPTTIRSKALTCPAIASWSIALRFSGALRGAGKPSSSARPMTPSGCVSNAW